MIKGVIFDLDGVLVSTDMLHYSAWKWLSDQLGIRGFTKADNMRQRGVSRMASLEVVLGKGGRSYSQTEKERLAEKKNDYYRQLLKGLTPADVLPGALDTIKALHSMGIFIGIGSVSKNTPVILERTGLKSYIDAVSCGLDITHSKPHPEVFLVAADKLGLSCDTCLVVEDADAGIEAAKAAGMIALGVGPASHNPDADYSAASLAETIDWSTMLSDSKNTENGAT
jgi:beta-phosphoglucomutase